MRKSEFNKIIDMASEKVISMFDFVCCNLCRAERDVKIGGIYSIKSPLRIAYVDFINKGDGVIFGDCNKKNSLIRATSLELFRQYILENKDYNTF